MNEQAEEVLGCTVRPAVSLLPSSASSTFLALLVNSDLLFCLQFYSACPLVNVPPCRHSQLTDALLSVSLSHINTPHSVSSLSPVPSPLLPSHQATSQAAARFLFCSGVLLAFVVSQCCQLSPLSTGPWVSITMSTLGVPLAVLVSLSVFESFCHVRSSFFLLLPLILDLSVRHSSFSSSLHSLYIPLPTLMYGSKAKAVEC